MAITLGKIEGSLYLYAWEGTITLGDIRASMIPEFDTAERVIFDLTEVDRHPLHLVAHGTHRHRQLSSLRHIYVVCRTEARGLAQLLVTATLRQVPYSLYGTREEALQQARQDASA